MTTVMIEHDMDGALDRAERVAVPHFGVVVADPRTMEINLGE